MPDDVGDLSTPELPGNLLSDRLDIPVAIRQLDDPFSDPVGQQDLPRRGIEQGGGFGIVVDDQGRDLLRSSRTITHCLTPVIVETGEIC